jgi:hypothetical protein
MRSGNTNRSELKTLLVFVLALTIFTSCKKYYATDSSDDDQINNIAGHEEASDYIWNDSQIIDITLNGTSITENSDAITTEGSKATIISAGTYRISGTLTNGQIIVSTADENIVRLIFNGVNITCSSSAPVYVRHATKVMIVLADNTVNSLTDGTSFTTNADGEPDATVFSKSYLSFFGTGSLTIDGNYKDGIACKDGLIIKSGIINISSADDGIRGKDYLIIKDGNITVNATGDGLKSDNEDDTDLGYITIENGSVNIVAGGDGVNAQTNLLINDGSITITTGGGAATSTGSTSGGGRPGTSSGGYTGTVSAKALKAGTKVTIDKGTFVINSADDAIHSNNSVVINGGTLSLASGDDAIHAPTSITISNETMSITKCYEGIESALITVNSGYLSLVSTDDGFNATKGQATEANDGSYLYIKGGNTVINSSAGDGLDSNGNVEMTGGTVVVHGPQSSPEVGIDVNGTFNISGGFLFVTGPNSGNMIEATSTTSSQYAIKVTMSGTLGTGSLFHIQDASGTDLVTYKPVRTIYYVVFSSQKLTSGATYSIYTGGSSTGTNSDGLYTGGTYSSGTLKKSFTVSGKVTNVSF